MSKYKVILLLFVGFLAFSCQQMPDDEGFMSDTDEVLDVQVRSVAGEEIIYPVYLYAFGEDGKLVTSQDIEGENEDISLLLAEGDYKIVAVAGLSNAYQLPENPSLDDLIVSVGDDGAKTPLMMGRADVSVTSNSKARAELMLTHVVAGLNVTLKNIPDDVAEVQLSLSPLYASLSMEGQYSGDSQKVRVKCTSASDGVWKAGSVYIFPGSGQKTSFSICFRKNDGSEVTYGYIYKGVPEANKPFNVTGTYSEEGMLVGGSFDVNDWEEAINVEFEFGANVVSDDTENGGNDNPSIDLTGVPEIGAIWNDMIVVDIAESDGKNVDLLLLSLDEWDATTSIVEDVISGYSINGIAEWRLPNYEEAQLLRSRFSGQNRLDLNELIAEYDSGLYGIDGEERYLCLKNGTYYSFKFVGGTTISMAGEKRSYYVRLVKTYRLARE